MGPRQMGHTDVAPARSIRAVNRRWQFGHVNRIIGIPYILGMSYPPRVLGFLPAWATTPLSKPQSLCENSILPSIFRAKQEFSHRLSASLATPLRVPVWRFEPEAPRQGAGRIAPGRTNMASSAFPSPVNGLALSTSPALRELATLPTSSGFSNLMDTLAGNGTGLLQAAQLRNLEAAVRKLSEARQTHLPPGKKRCLGSGGESRAPPCLPFLTPAATAPRDSDGPAFFPVTAPARPSFLPPVGLLHRRQADSVTVPEQTSWRAAGASLRARAVLRYSGPVAHPGRVEEAVGGREGMTWAARDEA
jgi:hypothetical protein